MGLLHKKSLTQFDSGDNLEMRENYVQASICSDCQEVIVLRQLGNIWKLPYMSSRQDKKEHKPTVIFSTMFDARKVKSEANHQYWKMPDRNKMSYNKARRKSIDLACDVLGYVATE